MDSALAEPLMSSSKDFPCKVHPLGSGLSTNLPDKIFTTRHRPMGSSIKL